MSFIYFIYLLLSASIVFKHLKYDNAEFSPGFFDIARVLLRTLL